MIAGIEVIGFLGEDQAAETAGEDGQGDIARGGETPRRALDRLSAVARLAAALRLQLSEALHASLRRWMLGAQLRARRMRAAGLLLVAVLVSVGAGIGLRSWLPQKRVPQQTGAAPVALPAPTKSVLVARQRVARGGIVKASDIAWQPWPTDRISPSYIVLGTHNAAEFYGFVARVPIAPGEPLSEDKIVSVGEHGSLTAMLRPGMRAVSVGMTPETAAGGLIMPGDQIDVVLTVPVLAADRRDPNDSDSRHGVETVLSDIRVLAVDQELDAHSGRAALGSAVTLETTPKQAEILALSEYLASFYNSKLALSLNSLVPVEAAAGRTPRTPSGTGDRAARSSMTDADISKFMPQRGTVASGRTGGLTIVRRGTATHADGS